jgi:hypothetical protein
MSPENGVNNRLRLLALHGTMLHIRAVSIVLVGFVDQGLNIVSQIYI